MRGMTTLLIFILIFGWKIYGYFDISAITAGILASIYLYGKFKDTNPEERLRLFPIKCLYCLTIYSCIVGVFTSFNDIQIILRSLRALVMLIASLWIYDSYKEKGKEPSLAIAIDVFVSLLLHGIIMLLMYCFDSLRTHIYSITDAFSYINLSSPFLDGLRISGLTYGLSQTSVLQLFGILLIPAVVQQYSSKIKRFLIILTLPLLFVSMLISGRSGLFIGLLMVPVALWYFSRNFSIKKVCMSSVGVILLGLVVFSCCAVNLLPEKLTNYTFNTNKEVFDALVFQGFTVNHLVDNMFFLPDTVFDSIFGCGNLGRTDYDYIESDVGYVRSIYAVGILGTVLTILPYLWGIYIYWKKRNQNETLAFAAIAIFLASLILNFKELALLTRNQWTIQALLLVSCSFDNKKENSELFGLANKTPGETK